MLFFIVFLLFSVLILRLGVVQIVYGEDYKREIERTEDVTVNNPVPRGKMYDAYGNIIVDNYLKMRLHTQIMVLVSRKCSKSLRGWLN